MTNDKMDKLTFLIGKLATQFTPNRQSKPLKPRVSQSRGRLLYNFSRVNCRYMMEIEFICRIIKMLEDAISVSTTETIEVIGGIKMDPMIDREEGIETEKTQVDIKVTELIGMCTVGRDLAQEL